jgi:hypothetical protein
MAKPNRTIQSITSIRFDSFFFYQSIAANLPKIIGIYNSCDNPISLFAQSNKRKHKSKRPLAQFQKTCAEFLKLRHQQMKEPRPLGRGSYSKNKIVIF